MARWEDTGGTSSCQTAAEGEGTCVELSDAEKPTLCITARVKAPHPASRGGRGCRARLLLCAGAHPPAASLAPGRPLITFAGAHLR